VLAMKRNDSGIVSQEQWVRALKRDDSRMFEFKRSKTLFLRERGLLSYIQRFP